MNTLHQFATPIRKQYLAEEDAGWDRDLARRSGPIFKEAAELCLAETRGAPPTIYLPTANRQRSTRIFQEISERAGEGALVVGGDLVWELVKAAGDKEGWPCYYDLSSLERKAPESLPVLAGRLDRGRVRELTDCGAHPVLIAANALNPPFEDGSVDIAYDRLGAIWHAAYVSCSRLHQQLGAFWRILSPDGILVMDASGGQMTSEITRMHANCSSYEMAMDCFSESGYIFPDKNFPKEGLWNDRRYSFESTLKATDMEHYLVLRKLEKVPSR